MKLIWTDPSPPNEQCRYHHTIAETPFGRFLLTWKGWKDYPDYGFDETPWGGIEYHGWSTVGDAQQWAGKEMDHRIALCSTPPETSPLSLQHPEVATPALTQPLP